MKKDIHFHSERGSVILGYKQPVMAQIEVNDRNENQIHT